MMELFPGSRAAPPEAVRRFAAEGLALEAGIWQEPLLDARGLASFCSDRGIQCRDEHIELLWLLGLLRADLVRSKNPGGIKGLRSLGVDLNGLELFEDARKFPRRTKLQGKGKLNRRKLKHQPLFHPFRAVVLAHLWHEWDFGIHQLQFLIDESGGELILEWHRRRFRATTSGPQFWATLGRLSDAVDLAVAGEPFALPKMRTWVRRQVNDQTTLEANVALYWSRQRDSYRSFGEHNLERARIELLELAHRCDPNGRLHLLLRLASDSFTRSLRGALSVAILAREAAETLRRCSEEALEQELPEENEVEWGGYLSSYKLEAFGTARVLEDRAAMQLFTRSVGLDFGLRVRWYVEGKTEFLALRAALAGNTAVEVINLRGRTAENRGKQLSFEESLRADLKSQIFSFVSVDKDRGDSVRALNRALEDKAICGAVLLSDPDFEFGNYSLNELQEVLLQLSGIDRSSVAASQLLRTTSSAKSGKEFERLAARCHQTRIVKSDTWGPALMKLALERPSRPGHKQQRNIVRMLWGAFQAVLVDYKLSKDKGPWIVGTDQDAR